MSKFVPLDFISLLQIVRRSVRTYIKPCDVVALVCSASRGLETCSESGYLILGCITSRLLQLPQAAHRVRLSAVQFLALQSNWNVPSELYARRPNWNVPSEYKPQYEKPHLQIYIYVYINPSTESL